MELIDEILNKSVTITFLPSASRVGGVVCAIYTVIGYMDGYLKVKDYRDQVAFYKLDQIKQIDINKQFGESL